MKFISFLFVFLLSLSLSAQTNDIDSTSIIVNESLTIKIAPLSTVIIENQKLIKGLGIDSSYQFVVSAVISYIDTVHREKKLFVRKIAGLEAVDEAIGRATEMGRISFLVGRLRSYLKIG